jgi:hypothetical protein
VLVLSAENYIIDILLILLVLRQLRARELTTRVVVLPLVLVAWAWISYFKTFSVNAHDVELIAIFTAVGVALGVASGLTTKVWESGQKLLFQAGVVAAATWIAGMGFRLGFQIWAYSKSGEKSITHFSITHHINSSEAWVCALLLMALGQVLARLSILQGRLYFHDRSERAMAR